MKREWNSSTCYMCGKTTVAARPFEICGDCAKEINKRKTEDAKLKASFAYKYDRAEFEVVEDMIHVEAGGFEPGARITAVEMKAMLATKVLAKGTIIKHVPTGKLYHVDYGGL